MNVEERILTVLVSLSGCDEDNPSEERSTSRVLRLSFLVVNTNTVMTSDDISCHHMLSSQKCDNALTGFATPASGNWAGLGDPYFPVVTAKTTKNRPQGTL